MHHPSKVEELGLGHREIICLGATPALQRVMVFGRLAVDAVNRARMTLDSVAGKAVNVAKVLHLLGERPVAMGFLGGERGARVVRELRERGVESEFVDIPSETRQCITVIDEAAGTHTELVEESQAVSEIYYAELLEAYRRRLAHARAVVLSGTLTPGGPVDFYRSCIELAKGGVLSVVDAQGGPLEEALRAGPGVVKPNRAELGRTVGRALSETKDLIGAMRELQERGAQRVVVTAGGESTYAIDSRRLWRITGPSIHVANPIGSGDAFAAGLARQLVRGDDLGEACRWATAAGCANAMTLLAGELDPSEVERLALETRVEQLE